MGVGCPWCAYCLDEALAARENAQGVASVRRAEAKAQEAEDMAELERRREAHRQAAQTGIPVS